MCSVLKSLFGNNLSSASAKTQRAEIYMRLIAYNLGCVLEVIFFRAVLNQKFIYIYILDHKKEEI